MEDFPFQAEVDDMLAQLTVQLQHKQLSHILAQAVAHALLQGGKRIRPRLVFAAAQARHYPHHDITMRMAKAIELIHCYSLVHDDLPCMDDDDLRRGQPTCHKVFGEAIALLAGDFLLTWAFEILADSDETSRVPIPTRLIALVAQQALSMVQGQQLDLAAEHQVCTQVQLEQIHQYKTGALIRACVVWVDCASASTVGHDSELSDHMQQFADALGLAYQVQDDVLDVVSTTAQLGKQVGMDAQLGKSTYVSLMGSQAAMDYAKQLFANAQRIAQHLPNPKPLLAMVVVLQKRTY